MNLPRRVYMQPTLNTGWSLFREFDDLLKGFNRDVDLESLSPNKVFSPKAEIKENDKGYLLSFDVPGIKEDDVKIEFHDSVLRIHGERKSELKDDKSGFFQTEKSYGRFERSFRLTETIDEAKVEANFHNGVLQIFLPKTLPKESKRIEIKKGETESFAKLFSKSDTSENPH